MYDGIIAYIVNFMSTKKEKEELIKIFKEYDTNQDGSISKEELINLYKKVVKAAKAEE